MSEVKVIQVLHHDSETDQTYTAEVIEKKDFDLLSQKLELAMNCLNNISDNNNEEIALQLSEWALEAIQKIEAL